MQAKKKLTALLLSLCMVLGMLPMTVFATGGTTTSGLTFEDNGDSVTITGSAWGSANLTIGFKIYGKPVTAIGEGAFSDNNTLTSVAILDSVTSIGKFAFYNCKSLSSVTFEEGSQLSSIGESAFNGCEKLGSITFTGNTAPELEADDVFDGCTALTAIHVPCGADGYTAANGWPEDKVQYEHVWAEDWTSDGTHHWKACTAEGCAEKDQYGVHQIANGVCTVCKAEVETSGVQTYAVKVNGITVTSANASDILGDADGDGATAYYDPAANTLTLDNAQLTSSGFGAVWAQEENFTLVLKGENQITGEGGFPHSAVYSHGAMTVKGNGSLTTSGTYFGLFGNNTITIEDGASVDLTVDFSSDEQDQPYAAVRAIGGLTVDGATLNAKNNATQDAGFGTPGINTDLTAINGAKVNISSVNDHGICGDVIVSGAGTVVNASSASGEHYGIFAGQEDIFGELGGDQKGIFTISDGAVVTASGGKGAMRWKPDLSGYTDPVVAAGDSAAAEEIIGDPAGTEYQNEKYVQVRSSLEPVEPTEPTDPTDPTTPTDPTEPTDPAKPEQQGKPSGQTESPQTGDSSDMALWIGLMLASCGGVLGMLFYRRKKAVAGK